MVSWFPRTPSLIRAKDCVILPQLSAPLGLRQGQVNILDEETARGVTCRLGCYRLNQMLINRGRLKLVIAGLAVPNEVNPIAFGLRPTRRVDSVATLCAGIVPRQGVGDQRSHGTPHIVGELWILSRR
jgi:hypothetical protein